MEFETRNWQEMGNETEFDTRNGRKWETRQDRIHNFSKKNEKKRGKTGKKRGKNTKKNMKKKQEKQKITRNTETRF